MERSVYLYVHVQLVLIYPTTSVPHEQVLGESGQTVHNLVMRIQSTVSDK